MQTKHRRHRTSDPGLYCLLKESSKNGNGLVLLTEVGKSVRFKWVNITQRTKKDLANSSVNENM